MHPYECTIGLETPFSRKCTDAELMPPPPLPMNHTTIIPGHGLPTPPPSLPGTPIKASIKNQIALPTINQESIPLGYKTFPADTMNPRYGLPPTLVFPRLNPLAGKYRPWSRQKPVYGKKAAARHTKIGQTVRTAKPLIAYDLENTRTGIAGFLGRPIANDKSLEGAYRRALLNWELAIKRNKKAERKAARAERRAARARVRFYRDLDRLARAQGFRDFVDMQLLGLGEQH